jgi:hypothetical protein
MNMFPFTKPAGKPNILRFVAGAPGITSSKVATNSSGDLRSLICVSNIAKAYLGRKRRNDQSRGLSGVPAPREISTGPVTGTG